MSRSRRKSPFTGITSAPSDKRDKAASSSAYRHALKQAIALAPETPPPTVRQITDPRSLAKEGKSRFDPAEVPRLMRK